MVTPNPIASKKSKEDVHYMVGRKCGNCINFQHPDSCAKVNGFISPEAVCDLFEVEENSRPYDKGFFMKEAMKHG